MILNFFFFFTIKYLCTFLLFSDLLTRRHCVFIGPNFSSLLPYCDKSWYNFLLSLIYAYDTNYFFDCMFITLLFMFMFLYIYCYKYLLVKTICKSTYWRFIFLKNPFIYNILQRDLFFSNRSSLKIYIIFCCCHNNVNINKSSKNRKSNDRIKTSNSL